jgi:hypothetical protein
MSDLSIHNDCSTNTDISQECKDIINATQLNNHAHPTLDKTKHPKINPYPFSGTQFRSHRNMDKPHLPAQTLPNPTSPTTNLHQIHFPINNRLLKAQNSDNLRIAQPHLLLRHHRLSHLGSLPPPWNVPLHPSRRNPHNRETGDRTRCRHGIRLDVRG